MHGHLGRQHIYNHIMFARRVVTLIWLLLKACSIVRTWSTEWVRTTSNSQPTKFNKTRNKSWVAGHVLPQLSWTSIDAPLPNLARISLHIDRHQVHAVQESCGKAWPEQVYNSRENIYCHIHQWKRNAIKEKQYISQFFVMSRKCSCAWYVGEICALCYEYNLQVIMHDVCCILHFCINQRKLRITNDR